MHTIKLNNGLEIPVLGLGTWQSKEDAVQKAVVHALQNGYTHIDTAAVYENEKEVGDGIIESGVAREDIFLTSKVWNDVSTYEGTLKAFEDSIQKLQTSYLDLYLIHWPGPYARFKEVYRAMEELYEQGKVKAIGVSNFNVHHLNELMKDCKVTPVVNQVECHVKYQNQFLNEFCNSHNITLQAYAPMMSWKVGELANIDVVSKLAEKYGKTPTQIALRWLIQRDIIVLPKSVTPSRIEENIQVFDFELSDEDMAELRWVNDGTRLFIEPDNMDYGFYK
ncbi:aldo/keto reductase [Sediminitomix flava]|uniref:Diketogulonate reductase-like aldo/keto reductase n=1 Tax=Sediminitomix flava TaxID=379075 RepID=A0A315Z972_SEDFL|nr:aldo/keto reductase [Sediminitomix flava]PWJ41105.1 diketogulonate reductase-like aldo/keto reductase [Sediminitomix flava]